jgi:hypothetical protein
MIDPTLLKTLFARFGVVLSDAEVAAEIPHDPREALVTLFANREISARFDAAHSRPPEESDIEALLDMYETLVKRPP